MNELPSNRREDKNLCGTRINHFKVIGSNEEKIGHNRVWLCKCDCGRITYVRHSELLTGRAKSCGCFNITTQITKPRIMSMSGFRTTIKTLCRSSSM